MARLSRLERRLLPALVCCGVLIAATPVAVGTSSAAGQPARRIISLAPHLTELVFAAGAGHRLVGAVAYSDYPPAARELTQIGDAFRIDLERVLALEPDLVLAWESGTPREVVGRLEALGLRVVSMRVSRLGEVAAALRLVGRLAGTEPAAESAAAAYEQELTDLRDRYAGRSSLRVFIEIGDRPLYTVNGQHPISELVSLCGGDNVFAGLDSLAPTIGAEAVIATDPDVILATDDSGGDPRLAWSRWTNMTAIRAGNVFVVSSDLVARATPRLIAGARDVCQALEEGRQNLGKQVARRPPASEH